MYIFFLETLLLNFTDNIWFILFDLIIYSGSPLPPEKWEHICCHARAWLHKTFEVLYLYLYYYL